MVCYIFQDASLVDVQKFISNESVANITQFRFIQDASNKMTVSTCIIFINFSQD